MPEPRRRRRHDFDWREDLPYILQYTGMGLGTLHLLLVFAHTMTVSESGLGFCILLITTPKVVKANEDRKRDREKRNR